MQISFYQVIQDLSEQTGKEITSKDITHSFRHTYHLGGSIFDGRLVLKSFSTTDLGTPSSSHAPTPELSASDPHVHGRVASLSLNERAEPSPDRGHDNERNLQSVPKRMSAKVLVDNKMRTISGEGNGPLSSFLNALETDLGITLSIREYSEHGVGAGSEVKAATYVELIPSDTDPKDKTKGGFWGVGVDADITASGLKAVMSAANGFVRARGITIAEAQA